MVERDVSEMIPLQPLEFRVLLVLMEQRLHGYGIAKAVEERDPSLGRIFPTNLYRRLRDMRTRGLIDEDAGAEDARGRRQFQITEFGVSVAYAEMSRLEGLVVDARQIVAASQHAGGV